MIAAGCLAVMLLAFGPIVFKLRRAYIAPLGLAFRDFAIVAACAGVVLVAWVIGLLAIIAGATP